MDQEGKGSLERDAKIGSEVRDLCKHPGYEHLKAELNKKLEIIQKKWFDASPEEGEKMKYQAKAYNDIFDVLKTLMIKGDLARKKLQDSDTAPDEDKA